MSTGGTTTSGSGSGSGSEADLPESEYGPLESDDEDRLSATGLFCTKNQARKTPEAKIRERLLAALPRRATVGKRYTTADRGRSGSGSSGWSGSTSGSTSGSENQPCCRKAILVIGFEWAILGTRQVCFAPASAPASAPARTPASAPARAPASAPARAPVSWFLGPETFAARYFAPIRSRSVATNWSCSRGGIGCSRRWSR